ncbi:hypothetical protein [Caulobacter vibrioides]|nr:hypothetical protein [Caulobacter vibrioides]YP_002515596.2 hypothetical protein CCNA_00221 [Caulobacter vibrioides NA1000]ACL93688.2 hypothetical protein CCNA_00221 [Caulobacter vibrioides NA1000]ATC27053.1 hypothetical protein CA607_01130 [Caulobacter vibrioides]QXZ52314.1 hypothetical protein KZH45_01140 [Caulobacter vibrioides]
MSCDAVAFSAMLWMASFNPEQTTGPALAVAQAPAAPASVADEPLFIDIVKRARQLKAQTEAYRAHLAKTDQAAAASPLKGFDAFAGRIGDLAALDMKGHVTLKERGAVDDLKCILRGISQDLPEKLAAVRAATTIKAQDLALRDMVYLLNDNVEVITAPPQPAA